MSTKNSQNKYSANIWEREIVIYNGFRDNAPKQFEDEDLVAFLTTFPPPECSAETCIGRHCSAKEKARCWSPVSISGNRSDENVTSINYVVLDLDHLKAGQLDAIRASLEEYEYIIHSTHSHAEGDESYRLIVPLSRPCPVARWTAAREAIVEALRLPADPTTKNPSRIYACPTARDGVEPVVYHHRGEPIDLDDVYETIALIAADRAQKNTPPPEPIDLTALRDMVASRRTSKARSGEKEKKEQAELLAHVLDGTPIADPGGRNQTLFRIMSMLAYCLPANTPFEAAFELLRACLSATDLEPEGFEYWKSIAAEQYARKMEERGVWEAQRTEESSKREETRKLAIERMRARSTTATIIESLEQDGRDWKDLLIFGKDGIRVCEHNARVLLSYAPELRDTVRLNSISKQIEIVSGPFEDSSTNGLATKIASWLQHTYSFYGHEALIRSALLSVALENQYNPIVDYLDGVTWDGGHRLDTFLEKYLGVEGNPQYIRAVSRKWLISLVARALRPGCKVDTVLILEGRQGAGKSTALETLVGSKYYLDTSLELGNKDTMQAMAGAWLVELGELASFRKAENLKVRQFLTSKVDKYRPPYGHAIEEQPRCCVFVGTSNEDDYLVDFAGNRRYWPVRVGKIELSKLAKDRDQLLAEARLAFKNGEIWHLSEEEEELAATETKKRMTNNPAEEAIKRWWQKLHPTKRPEFVTVLDIAESALMLSHDRITKKVTDQIGAAMRDLGFSKVHRRVDGWQRWFYKASDALLRNGLALVPPEGDK